MDPNDPTLNGENAETPAASQAGTITPDDTTSVNPTGAGTSVSPEEESWKNLNGSSQERFRSVTRENNTLREKLSEMEAKVNQLGGQYQTQINKPAQTTEVQEAVKRLSDVGIATKEEVNQIADQKLSGLIYKMELDRLEGKYDGSNGLPQFDREEYRDFIARNPQYGNYTPEDVYNKMYAPEIDEYKFQHRGQTASATRPTPSLRPTKTVVREEPLTPEMIDQRLREPDAMAWYDKNKEKINAVMSKTSTPSW